MVYQLVGDFDEAQARSIAAMIDRNGQLHTVTAPMLAATAPPSPTPNESPMATTVAAKVRRVRAKDTAAQPSFGSADFRNAYEDSFAEPFAAPSRVEVTPAAAVR